MSAGVRVFLLERSLTTCYAPPSTRSRRSEWPTTIQTVPNVASGRGDREHGPVCRVLRFVATAGRCSGRRRRRSRSHRGIRAPVRARAVRRDAGAIVTPRPYGGRRANRGGAGEGKPALEQIFGVPFFEHLVRDEREAEIFHGHGDYSQLAGRLAVQRSDFPPDRHGRGRRRRAGACFCLMFCADSRY